MKSTKSGSRTSRSTKQTSRQSSLTPRHQSIESLLTPKIPKRKKSDKKVEDKLINFHSHLRSQKAEKRLIANSERLKEVREAPSLYPGNKKIFRAKSQSEIEAIVNSLENSVKPKRRHTLKRVNDDGKRPQDVIQKPDTECIKEVLTRITPKHSTPTIDTKNLNIIEKTQLLLKLKTEKQSQNEEKKLKQELQECTFKPNTSKPKAKGLHKKSKSDSHLPTKPVKLQSPNQNASPLISNQIRPPAPNKYHKRVPSYIPSKGTFISSTLGKLSPGKVPGKEEISAKMHRLSLK